MPELKVLLSSLVTVWGVPEVFFQMMVVPAGIVSVAGLKAKVPPATVIMTVFVAPATAVVGVEVPPPRLPYPPPLFPLPLVLPEPLVAVGLLTAAGGDPVVVELLPQAARSASIARSRRQSQAPLLYVEVGAIRADDQMFLCILFFSLEMCVRTLAEKILLKEHTTSGYRFASFPRKCTNLGQKPLDFSKRYGYTLLRFVVV